MVLAADRLAPGHAAGRHRRRRNDPARRDYIYWAGEQRASRRTQRRRLDWTNEFRERGGLAGSSGSGDIVGVQGKQLSVFPGYGSRNPLQDTSTYLNQTFSSLGVTPGTYTWTWGSGAHADSFTLQIGPAATAAPEPATLTQLATGALGLLGYGWRRRRLAAA